MKRKVVSILMAAAMVLSCAACRGDRVIRQRLKEQQKTEETADTGEDAEAASKDSGDVKIAYIVKAMSDQFWIDMKEGADKGCGGTRVVVDFQAPEKETDVEVQIQYVENAITSGYDAIICLRQIPRH